MRPRSAPEVLGGVEVARARLEVEPDGIAQAGGEELLTAAVERIADDGCAPRIVPSRTKPAFSSDRCSATLSTSVWASIRLTSVVSNR